MTIEITREEYTRIDWKTGQDEISSIAFHAETHWGGPICEIHFPVSCDKRPQLSWASEGTRAEYSEIEIAEVMSKAFAMAKEELEKLENGG